MSGYCTHGVSLESPCVKCALVNRNGPNSNEPFGFAPMGIGATPAPIGETNAPIDLPTIEDVSRMVNQMAWDAADRAVYGDELKWRKKAAEWRDEERARCRAIILELFGRDWHGNQAVEWIDSGLTAEQLKEGKK